MGDLAQIARELGTRLSEIAQHDFRLEFIAIFILFSLQESLSVALHVHSRFFEELFGIPVNRQRQASFESWIIACSDRGLLLESEHL